MKVALTIAGSDSSGGAGIQMDLKVFQACGVYGTSVVTALTAQNTQGVRRTHRITPGFVAEQIDAVTRDMTVAAAKTGMLDREQIVQAVADRVRRRGIPLLVVDPVIVATDGTPLLNGRGLKRLKAELLPLAAAVTPNVAEAELLSGIPIADLASLHAAALRIGELGAQAVVVKGGHREGPATDILWWEGTFHEFPGERLNRGDVHGTGCAYSAALTARLALGDTMLEACRFARAYIQTLISRAATIGKGALLMSDLAVAPGAENPNGS